MHKRLLISAGGTGGHLFPAIGLAEQLKVCDPEIEILFAAGGLSTNSFFNQEFPFHSIESGAFTKRSFLQCLKSGKSIVKGVLQSRRILSDFTPHAVVGFGSYHTFPMLLAARYGGHPIFLHEQNSKPGKVIRLFAKQAVMTGVFFPEAVKALSGPAQELAMPLRADYSLMQTSKEDAYRYFELDPNKQTLLAFGGSQGAKALNELVARGVECLPERQFQLLQFTGDQASVLLLQKRYQNLGIHAVVKAFEPSMNLAWRIADLAIARAGAGTIAELIEFEVPTLLIPYPHASENHQEHNADFVVDTLQGGWKFREQELTPTTLAAFLQQQMSLGVMTQESELKTTREQLQRFKRKKSNATFAGVIHEFLESL